MKPKRKRRGGRPRTQNVPREANGRVSRTYTAAERRREAIEARVRVFGLSEKDALDARAGSVVGRMSIAGTLSRDQYDAAQKYAEVRSAYFRSIDANPGFKEPPPEFEGDGDFDAFCQRAKDKFGKMMGELRDLCVEQRSPGPMSALEHFINRDFYLASLEGDLRVALNRLYKHFFEGRRRQ